MIAVVKTLVLLLIFITGCCSQELSKTNTASLDQNVSSIVKRAFTDSFIVLDPAFIQDSNSHEICRQIYDGLVDFDENGRVVPALAHTWQISEDKLEYTFFLRENVFFHSRAGGNITKNNGRKMTAHDVEFSYKRLLSPHPDSQASFFLQIKGSADYFEGKTTSIEGIEVLDETQIRFTLNQPFAPFVSLLAICNACIVPKEDAENLAKIPVGTGPFRWVGYEKNKIVLEKNEFYFSGEPMIDGIEFLFIPDELESFRAFLNGELSFIEVPDSQYRALKQNPNYSKQIIEKPLWGTNYLGFNMKVEPFDNLLLRQALNYAIDKKSIASLIFNDQVTVANGVIPPGIPGFTSKSDFYPYDIDKARALLEEAGFPNGVGLPELVLQYNSDPIHSRVSEFVLANLKDIGIKCRIKKMDFEAHLQAIQNEEVSFFRLGWTADYPDPDSFLYTLFHSSNIGSGYNFSNFSIKEVDDLLDAARVELEQDKRLELYQQAEKIILAEAPWIFLYFYNNTIASQKHLKGLTLGSMGISFLNYRDLYIINTSSPE